MDITQQDAQESLAAIKSVAKQTHRSVAAGYASSLLILWGLIGAVEFILAHLMPHRVGFIFNCGNALGILPTIYICRNWPKNGATRTPEDSRLGLRIFLLGIILAIYATMWARITEISGGPRLCLFFLSVAMFGYIVIGLWFESYFMLWLGLAVTGLAVLGFSFWPDYFYLWMAPTGGGAALGTGIYLKLRWSLK